MSNSSRVDEAVALVSLWKGQEPKVSQLSGGLTNENYLVEAGGEKYVMRIPGRSTELLGIDRANEVFNTSPIRAVITAPGGAITLLTDNSRYAVEVIGR